MALRSLSNGLGMIGSGIAKGAKKATDISTLRNIKRKASKAGLGKAVKNSRQRGKALSGIRNSFNNVSAGVGDNAQRTVKRNLNRLKGLNSRAGRNQGKKIDNLMSKVDAGDANMQQIAEEGLDLVGDTSRMGDLTNAKIGSGTLGYMGQRRLRGRTAAPRPEMLGGGRLD